MNTYNIVCIADSNYIQHTAVMLCSLLENNKDKYFRIFLMTFSIQEKAIGKLRQMVKSHGSSITIIEDDYKASCLDILKSATKNKSWNPIMYLKTLIPQYIPNDVERLLFLDVDMIVNSDIETLYNINLADNAIAACEDYLYQQVHKDRLSLTTDELYINSGVMVVNLVLWRKMETMRPMNEFLKEHADKLNNDQDVFALYFRNKIQLLPTNQWNATTFFFENTPRILPKYLPEVTIVRTNPYIIHFCEPVKPWFTECKHPYKHLYKKYMQLTPWKGYTFTHCKTIYGKPAWEYTFKYWLNRLGLRKDAMMTMPIKQ